MNRSFRLTMKRKDFSLKFSFLFLFFEQTERENFLLFLPHVNDSFDDFEEIVFVELLLIEENSSCPFPKKIIKDKWIDFSDRCSKRRRRRKTLFLREIDLIFDFSILQFNEEIHNERMRKIFSKENKKPKKKIRFNQSHDELRRKSFWPETNRSFRPFLMKTNQIKIGYVFP